MTPPVNDDFANAITISGIGSSGSYVIDDATTESGEPHPFGSGRPFKTIWFTFNGYDGGSIILDTQGSPAGDADSGDGEPSPAPFGNLDTQMALYRQNSSGFGGLALLSNNDDTLTDPDGYWSRIAATVAGGFTYYVQVGVFDASYVGSIVLNYALPEAPPPPFPLITVDDCPVMVQEQGAGRASSATYPHGGEFGSFHDGYLDWFEPGHAPGELLVWIGIGDYLGQSAPAGYTEVFNGLWDNAEISDPSPRGAEAASHYPVNSPNVSLIIAYRITTESLNGSVADTTIKGTITGLSYSDHSYPLWQAATGGDGNTGFGVRVYRFQLLQMGDDYPQVFNWPANPVKAGTLVDAPYTREFAENQESPSGADQDHVKGVNISDTTADHIGNHIYMTLVMNHGRVVAEWRTFDPDRQRESMDLLDQFYMFHGAHDIGTIYGGSQPNGTLFTGDHGYNDIFCQPFISNRNYFEPFLPASWVAGAAGDITWTAENGFSDTTSAPGHSLIAHTDSTGDEVWWDSALGDPGVDWYNWILTGGIAALQIVIQGPEVHRPINDDRANAFPITICPVTVAECVFGQTSEPGETYDGLGTPLNSSVWFTYTPTNSETGVPINTFTESSDPSLGDIPSYTSEYDTMIIVYDSAGNVVASNDDFVLFPLSLRLSQVTVDVVGGETYYIQVAGENGDEGRLLLTIGSEGACSSAYWGINASTPT